MDTIKLTGKHAVSDFVNQSPQAIEIFNRMNIDFCCGGDRSLESVCAEQNIDLNRILEELTTAPETPGDAETTDWTQLSEGELVDHILEVHHAYLKKALVDAHNLMGKVIQAHAANHPELIELNKLFMAFKNDLEPHMRKEEVILFPLIKRIEAGEPPAMPVANPIRVMRADHDRAGMLLSKMNALTNHYTTPSDGCASYGLLYEALKEMEADTHLHVHKENNLLFPQALKASMVN